MVILSCGCSGPPGGRLAEVGLLCGAAAFPDCWFCPVGDGRLLTRTIWTGTGVLPLAWTQHVLRLSRGGAAGRL